MIYFDTRFLKIGDILHVRTNTLFGKAIRACLGSFGNHDALIVSDGKDDWSVVEAVPGEGVKITSLVEYEMKMLTEKAKVSVYRVPNATDEQRVRVRSWALAHFDAGYGYDWKAIFGILFRTNKSGSEWKWYCTELVRDAWQAGGVDVWKKEFPTPRTTEKRALEGKLDVIPEVYCSPMRRASDW